MISTVPSMHVPLFNAAIPYMYTYTVSMHPHPLYAHMLCMDIVQYNSECVH